MPSTYAEYTAYEGYSQEQILFPFLEITDVKIFSATDPNTFSGEQVPLITNWTYVTNEYYNNNLNDGVSQLPFGNYAIFFENGNYIAKFRAFGDLSASNVDLLRRPATIYIYRNTTRNQVFNFVNGASLQADDLNKAYIQTLYLAQETKDLLDKFGGETTLAGIQANLATKISKFSPEGQFETQEISNNNINGTPLTITNNGLASNGAQFNGLALDVKGRLAVRGTTNFLRPINLNNQQITNIASPVNPSDVATKAYVDAVAQPVGGSIPEVPDGSITTAKLRQVAGEQAVTTACIQDNSITTSKLNINSVSAIKIQGSAVQTAKIENLAVTTPKIAGGAVTLAKLNADVIIPSDKLQNSSSNDALRAVSTNHIKDLAVTTEKINDGAVTSAKLAPNLITNALLPTPIEKTQIIGNKIFAGATTLNGISLAPFNNKKDSLHISTLTGFGEHTDTDGDEAIIGLPVTFSASGEDSYGAGAYYTNLFDGGNVCCKLEHAQDVVGNNSPIWRFYIKKSQTEYSPVGSATIVHLLPSPYNIPGWGGAQTPAVVERNWTRVPFNTVLDNGNSNISLNPADFSISIGYPIASGAKYNVEMTLNVCTSNQYTANLYLWTRMVSLVNGIVSYGSFEQATSSKFVSSTVNFTTAFSFYMQYYFYHAGSLNVPQGSTNFFMQQSLSVPNNTIYPNIEGSGYTQNTAIPHGGQGAILKVTRIK